MSNTSKHRKAWIVASLHYRKACLDAAGTMDHKIAYLAGQELGTIANSFGALDSEDPGCVQAAQQRIADDKDSKTGIAMVEEINKLRRDLATMTVSRDTWEARADRYADKGTELAKQLGELRADINGSIREAIAEVDKGESPESESIREAAEDAGFTFPNGGDKPSEPVKVNWDKAVRERPVTITVKDTCDPSPEDLKARFPHLSPVVARAAWAQAASLEID
jgi:hypothetical protein